MSFLLNYNYKFEVTPAGKDPLLDSMVIATGITSVDPDNNEESDETYYYDGGGAAERDITGFMMSYGFEGHRNYGNPAQDYIFSLANKTGPDRKCFFKVTEPNGDVWEGAATISDITLPGGDANSKGEVSFTISFDGQPTFVEAPNNVLPPLAKPTALSATSVTQTGFELTWQSVATGGEPLSHKIFKDGTLVDTVTVNAYTATGLTADTAYTYTVQSFYSNEPTNVSPISDPLNVTTSA